VPKTSELYAALERGDVLELPADQFPNSCGDYPEGLYELGFIRSGLLVQLKGKKFELEGMGSRSLRKLDVFEYILESPGVWQILTREEFETRKQKNEEAKANFTKEGEDDEEE
jgi:hypothetical protein